MANIHRIAIIIATANQPSRPSFQLSHSRSQPISPTRDNLRRSGNIVYTFAHHRLATACDQCQTHRHRHQHKSERQKQHGHLPLYGIHVIFRQKAIDVEGATIEIASILFCHDFTSATRTKNKNKIYNRRKTNQIPCRIVVTMSRLCISSSKHTRERNGSPGVYADRWILAHC